MCGIAGLAVGKQALPGGEGRRIVEHMCNTIAHRGPDGWGVWEDTEAGIHLGHRRLSIIDLSSAGAQPMASDDGKVVVTYNGEIYDFSALRADLERAGRTFRGRSDTEAIANGIAEWGIEALCGRIGGMFAMAVWMPETRMFFLVRDRLGKKPLYWTRIAGGGVAFGSELAALHCVPGIELSIDSQAAASFLRTGHVPEPLSIYAKVHKVGAGEILAFGSDLELRQSVRYWSVEDVIAASRAKPQYADLDSAVAAVEPLLENAVAQRMIADVPHGAFLSGGIDSSLVVALMQRQGSEPVKTFSIGYENSSLDESEDAKEVARHLGTDHRTFILQADDAIETIYNLPRIYSEPFADPSQIPTAIISRMAREHVTVVLTGDGGDEVFAGYNRHVASAGLMGRLDALPGFAQGALTGTMRALSPSAWDRLFDLAPEKARPRQPGEKMHKLAALLGLDPWDRYRQYTSQWDCYADIGTGREPDAAAHITETFAKLTDPVERLRYMDLIGYLTGDVLTKVDRATMAYGLEARAPLLDYRLVELSWQIPSAVHVSGGKGKQVLRTILEKHVPRAMFERPKSGFGVPIGDWLRGPLRDWAEDLLSPAALDALGLVDSKALRSIWQAHLEGRVNAQYGLWNVLMLQAWLRAQAGASSLAKAA
jgi:asparagine synthase (glutamine-hydrolysing)